ncbi:MAG: 50S ribosomal protein L7/L12 [Candidatus Omnitrophica bacterium]|nr:50S ribosomal protein L7/L12 [Candidatus Omnitrophota bacterium]
MSEEKGIQETQEKPKASKKTDELIKSIEEMSVLELSNLVKALEERFGVSSQMPVSGVVMAQGAQTAAQAKTEEKSTFTVVLAEVGAQKIQVIKEIRAVTNLGLKEAKDLVEAAPKPIKENVPKEEAENIKSKLEAVGAKVEFK